jgi:hypothetical protein
VKAPGNILVGVASTKILDADLTRRGLFIRNMSDNTVCLSFGCAAEMNKGICLFTKESFSMTPDDFNPLAVYGISDVADSMVAFQEFVLIGENE